MHFHTGLIVIDEAPIRARALKALKKAQDQLDGLNREWAVFNERDKPAYTSWLGSAFRDLHAEIARVESEIFEKHRLVEKALHESLKRGISFAKAYQRVRNGQDEEEESADTDEEAAYQLFEEMLRAGGIDPELLDDEERETMFKRFKAAHGFNDDDFEREERERWEHARAEAWSETSPKEPPAGSRLKQLYRALARRLHPDLKKGEQTGEERDLWLKVLEAYERRDLARLESLMSFLGIIGAANEAPSTISEILALKKRVRATIASMRKRLRNAHRDRAWGFSRPEGRSRKRHVRQAVERELNEQLEEARSALAALDDFIDEQLSVAA